MTPKQYKAIIESLGLSQQAAGVWLGVSKRTGQNYAAKGPPEPVAKLLRLMVKHGFVPEDVR
jgi:DNA-binding transcriptional regulator YiaG